MRVQKNMLHIKEKDKTSEKELNKTEISKLPDKDLKLTIKDVYQTQSKNV